MTHPLHPAPIWLDVPANTVAAIFLERDDDGQLALQLHELPERPPADSLVVATALRELAGRLDGTGAR